MRDLSCATCPFSEKLSTGATDNTACHLGRFANEPRHPSTWWCSEHPLAPGQRDRIAEIAMQGWLSSWPADKAVKGSEQALTEASYVVADAMLIERAKKGTEGT